MQLNKVQVSDCAGKLSDHLTKHQFDIVEAVATLLDSSATANLGKVLSTVYPNKSSEYALNSLRGVRKQINDAAKKGNIEFAFCVDSEKRKSPDQRTCWFEGGDLSAEKMERMQAGLLRNNPEYQAKDFTPPLARSKFRVFVSSSDNRGAEGPTDEERTAIEDFLRRLRQTLKALNRSDLAEGMYHFREQQDNLMHKRIETALDSCEVGLLLISKPYLASQYIRTNEIPHFNPSDYDSGRPNSKDAIPLLFSPCFGSDPVKINESLGLSMQGGLQILRYQDKWAFTECDEDAKERFVDSIAERLCKKLPPDHDPGGHPTKRCDHLDIFTMRQRDKLNTDSSYRPDEWEPTRGECSPMGRAAASKLPKPETDEEQLKGFDALEHLLAWARNADSAHVHALLGDLGSGKTFTCRMLALELLRHRESGDNATPLPIYIDLREVGFTSEWQAAPTLDNILEGWLKHWQFGINPDDEHGLDVAAIKRLSQAGAVWIFDGFDEISSHLPRNGDNAFFKELLRPVAPQGGKESKSKVLVSCRSHYFPTLAKQNATLLEEARGVLRQGATKPDSSDSPELICDSTLLLPFDEEQIKSYLVRALGEAEAGRAVEVIAGIHDMTELSRQPYLLRLIKGQIAELETMKSQGKPVNAASLYGLFVADWLQRDEGKHTIEPEDKIRLMERLAAQMWAERQRGWSFEQLQRWVLGQMESEPEWRFRYQPLADLVAKDLHTASFIVRYGESGFRFIHTSMQEYFVAAHLLRGLREKLFNHWSLAQVSPETLSFFADLWRLCSPHEQPALFQAQRQLHASPPSSDAALLALDYLLTARQNEWPHVLPERIDLSGTDIGQRTISGQPDQRWRLELLGMDNANASQIQMSYLTINRLEARRARLAGSCWQHCTVEAANLDQANLAGAHIRHCDWRMVSFDRAILHHAELRLSRFDPLLTKDAAEITGHPWWLSANPAPPWAVAPQTDSLVLPVYFARAGHAWVTCVAWRGDGQRLATAGYDGGVKIWDADSGACLMTLQDDARRITSVAWRGDGQRLASAGEGGVRVWDADSGRCQMTLGGDESGVTTSLAWCSDGQRLASAGDGGVRIWNAESGACLMTMQEGASIRINSVAWCGDGQRLASAGQDGVRIWDADSGACLMTMQESASLVRGSVAWRGDGQRLASAGHDGVRIWDANSGACLITLAMDVRWVTTVAWCGDGQRLASAGDGGVLIWDADSGACLMKVSEGRVGANNSMAWCDDGQRLASVGHDGVQIWDADSGACLMILKSVGGDYSVAWRGDGPQFASAGYDSVRIWDADSGACLTTLPDDASRITSMAWRGDGQRLALAGPGGVRIWDADSWACLMTMHEDASIRISSVAWRGDGQRLASAGNDGVRIWDADSGACLMTMHEGAGRTTSVAWRGDGQRLASTGAGCVRIWDADSGECLLTMRGGERTVSAVAWRGDGKRLVSTGYDGQVRIWDADSGACLMKLDVHSDAASPAVAWHGDGQRIATAGPGCVQIWDAESGACLMTLEGAALTSSVAWCSDGRRLVSAGFDGVVRIWNADSGALVYKCIAVGDITAVLNACGEVLSANDAAWPYLARMGKHPVNGNQMWIPAEVQEIV